MIFVRRVAVLVLVLVASALGCGTTATSGTPATSAATAPPATTPVCTPATTTATRREDGSVRTTPAPPPCSNHSTDGTQPAPSTTSAGSLPTTNTQKPVVADATHGVIRGRVEAGGEPVTGQISISTDSPSATDTVGFTLDTGPDGEFTVAVAPDAWRVKLTGAAPTQPPTAYCQEIVVLVDAGRTFDIILTCNLVPQ